MKANSSDPIREYQRQVIARRRAGCNTECECGEARIPAIPAGSNVCASCKRIKKGYTTMDKHHVAGKANSSVTVPIWVNDHRAILSEAQRDWPKATLENSDSCPLLRAAACIRGFIDTLYFLIEKMLLWVAELLEALGAFLAERLGPQWWLDTPISRFTKDTK